MTHDGGPWRAPRRPGLQKIGCISLSSSCPGVFASHPFCQSLIRYGIYILIFIACAWMAALGWIVSSTTYSLGAYKSPAGCSGRNDINTICRIGKQNVGVTYTRQHF